MTHPDMAALFDLLDQWRYLPSYRLESRADAVFGLFLPHALDRHLAPRGIAIDPRIISEFPLGQGTPNVPTRPTSSRSPGTASMPSLSS